MKTHLNRRLFFFDSFLDRNPWTELSLFDQTVQGSLCLEELGDSGSFVQSKRSQINLTFDSLSNFASLQMTFQINSDVGDFMLVTVFYIVTNILDQNDVGNENGKIVNHPPKVVTNTKSLSLYCHIMLVTEINYW